MRERGSKRVDTVTIHIKVRRLRRIEKGKEWKLRSDRDPMPLTIPVTEPMMIEPATA